MDDATRLPPDDAAAAPALADYALGARLAEGARADAYDAVHAPTGAPRVVYVLRAEAMRDHALVHRVVCEVDAARWLRHPVTAKADRYGDTADGRLYVAVERPPGDTLRALIAAGERFPAWRVARLASRLVEALDEAHAVGLAHGRLTPDAVTLAPDGGEGGAPLVTLAGLGASAVAHAPTVPEIDRPYVSPEQLAGGDADARSDVFGLASLLHHLLTGAPPGDAAAPAAGPTREVLAAARDADPRRRPATVKAFWEELLAALVADASAAATAAPSAVGAPAGDAVGALDLELLLDTSVATLAPVAASVAAPVPAQLPAPTFEPLRVAPPTADDAPRSSPPLPRRRERESERRRPVARDLDDAPAVSVVPSRRRRAAVTLFWCLAGPGIAAAVGSLADERPVPPPPSEPAWEPITHVGPPLAPDAFRIPTAADTAGARADTLPALPAFEPPDVELQSATPTLVVPAVVVRPEEFTRRLTP